MSNKTTTKKDHTNHLKAIGNRLSPLWPLKNFVAVNPYFGLHDMHIEEADTYLSKINGSGMFKSKEPNSSKENTNKIHTLSDFYSKISERAWNLRFVDYVSSWCAAYFDTSQSIMKYPKSNQNELFICFLEDLKIDKSLLIFGLKTIKSELPYIPTEHQEAATFILEKFQLQDKVLPLYLHRLLMQYQGWASSIRKNVWQDELKNNTNDELLQFQTCLLVLEYLIFKTMSDNDKNTWKQNISKQALQPISSESTLKHTLQNEFEDAQRNSLFEKINTYSPKKIKTPEIQTVFCIDVRSEIFRRHLESQTESIETIGFAGFFGAAFKFKTLEDHTHTNQLPVLLSPNYTVEESLGSEEKNKKAKASIRLIKDIKKAWTYFKLASVSCFSFMGPIGIFYFPILLKTIFLGEPYQETKSSPLKWKGQKTKISYSKNGNLGISIDEQVTIAQNVLKGLSLSHIAPLVALIGHESISQNNPYESALDCGACGGHSGQKNAEVMATLLNDKAIQSALQLKGIPIPKETYFISGVHNTTTDVITFFNTDSLPKTHQSLLNTLEKSCKNAAHQSRVERSKRLSISKEIDKQILNRSNDWSQIRPEWGLAGCNAFIAAPRHLTRELNLNGRAFLHSYNWKIDTEFSVLELILTAPVVVASWINLQYYASVIDNPNFGSGNKVLHNVVSGIGVLEGGYGDIRVGLPMQSLHDGTQWQHSVERLNVIIAAPKDSINHVLKKHTLVRNLFENRWIHLFVMSDDGEITHQYDNSGKWNAINLNKKES